MSSLSFISDEVFRELVQEVLDKAAAARKNATKNLESNALDPFAAVFEAASSGKSIQDWYADEENRQIQKTIQNAVGSFHQKLLGQMPGWKDLSTAGGIDVRSPGKKIVAEVKNKHNTMNSSSAEATYNKLANWLRYTDKGFTAYVVKIVPKSPSRFDQPWTHSAKLAPPRADIREIDGYSFYALATGQADALEKIYEKLRDTVGELTDDNRRTLANDPQAAAIFKTTFG